MTEAEKQELINYIVQYLIDNSQTVSGIPLTDTLENISSLPAIRQAVGQEEEVVRAPLSLLAPQLRYNSETKFVQYKYSDGEWIDLFDTTTIGGDVSIKDGIPVFDQIAQPENKPSLWVTPLRTSPAEDIQNNPILAVVLSKLDEALDRISDLEYQLNYKLDAGTISQGSPPEIESGIGVDPITGEVYEYETPTELEPTIFKIAAAKRCKKIELNSYLPSDGEFMLVTDQTNPMLYIGLNGKAYLIGGSGGGTDPDDDLNKVMEYIDMQVEGLSTIYRVRVDKNGQLKIYNRIIDTEQTPTITEAQKGLQVLKGLTISMVYAGGETTSTSSYQPVSHSFIELHNNRLDLQDVNLNGISLQYSNTTGANWTVYPLKGIIPYGHSFLIRCAPCSDVNVNTTVVDLTNDYDFDLPNLKISNTRFKLLLTVGTTPCLVANPMTVGIESTVFTDGYIDLVGAQSPSVLTASSIDGFEKYVYNKITPNRGMVRHFLADFNKTDPATQTVGGDTNDNLVDFRPVDYTMNLDVENTAEIYKPYTVKRGLKTVYYNKTDYKSTQPNMVTMTFGKNINTTRCFCWLSVGYYDEYLQYRLKGDTEWSKLGSINISPITAQNLHIAVHNRKRMIAENGTRYTSHKVILNTLQAVDGSIKEYEYRVGRDGCWSDIFNFKLKYYSPTTPFKFLHVTDQQGWSWEEYQPWKLSVNKIMADKDNHNGGDYDFIINTGDYTQNGNRANEWMDYYQAAKSYLPNYPMMGCIGNNDLGPEPGQQKGKTNPSLFSSFFCHEYDADNIPFLPLGTSWDMTNPTLIDQNLMRSVYSFEVGNTHFTVMNGYCYLEEKGDTDTQEYWFRADMDKANANPNIKWKVVITHDCPFSVVTNAEKQRTCRLNRDDSKDYPIDATYDPTRKYRWSRIFEEYNIDIVMGGHKHTYSRSKPVKEYVNPATNLVVPNTPLIDESANANGYTSITNPIGVVYITNQATGYKLQSNKELPGDQSVNPWCAKYFPVINGKVNPAQYFPTFINWSVGNSFGMNTFMISGTMTYDSKSKLYSIFDMYNQPNPSLTSLNQVDTMTITKS